MISMGIKARQTATGSPRAEVGEIDTRAPFQSVKAAVSLFGEVAFLGEKPLIKKSIPTIEQGVLDKETQLHLAQKELNEFKEQLENAETTKAQALLDLEKARGTLQDLTDKLITVSESKQSATETTEAVKDQVEQLEANSRKPIGNDGVWKEELDCERERYKTIITELDTAKQELTKIRQDFDATLEAKLAAFQRAADAQHSANANTDKLSEFSKEIAAMQESLGHLKLASLQSQQEQAEMLAEKDVHLHSHATAREEAEKKMLSLKEEFDPELTKSLEEKLAETTAGIEVLQEQVRNAQSFDTDSVRIVTLELHDAKKALQKVAEEESSLRSLVESLNLELESVKRDCFELTEKEAETESVAGNLHGNLEKSKAEIEAALAEETKAKDASDELILTLQQLSSESEKARREAEEGTTNAEELKQEAETAQIVINETEKKLPVALQEAEEAKAAEKVALDQIKTLSQRTNAAPASNSEFGADIKISTEEFEALSRKVEESENLAEMKVVAAMAQVEAINASEKEAVERLEATLKEIEDMKAAAEEALKKAEMAEAAKMAVEGELRRWRQEEQKNAAEASSRILEDTEMSSKTSPLQL